MIIDGKIKLLGDTHLGRRFLSNVPLHRRGDREKMVWNQFVTELDPEGCPVHIHMGDLFDKPVVDLGLILRTAQAYNNIGEAYADTSFYVLRGNHDATRDLEATTAFDIFDELLRVDNVHVVRGSKDFEANGLRGVCFGWDPEVSATEMVKLWAEIAKVEETTLAFGHWDVDLRSQPFNLIPTDVLSKNGIERAFTGHVHKPDSFKRDGVDVTVVGSMQPFAFGEQVDDTWYTELTLEELQNDLGAVKNKNVRVLLKQGEVFDLSVDCLQLQVIPAASSESSDLTVTVEDFDMSKLYNDTLQEFDIPETIKEQVTARWLKTFS